MAGLNWSAFWPLALGMMLVTYALRATFLQLHEKVAFPPAVQRALRYVPFAILSALVVPEVLDAGEGPLDPRPERLLAAAVAVLAAWRTRSVLLTLCLGMVVLWLAQALF